MHFPYLPLLCFPRLRQLGVGCCLGPRARGSFPCGPRGQHGPVVEVWLVEFGGWRVRRAVGPWWRLRRSLGYALLGTSRALQERADCRSVVDPPVVQLGCVQTVVW